MRQMKAWEVLEKAADLLDERGWSNWAALGPTFCAGNAIALVGNARDVLLSFEAQRALAAALPESTGWRRHCALYADRPFLAAIYEWNDAPGRTKEEVTSTMRAVAASLKAARTEGTRQHAAESTDADVDAENADVLA